MPLALVTMGSFLFVSYWHCPQELTTGHPEDLEISSPTLDAADYMLVILSDLELRSFKNSLEVDNLGLSTGKLIPSNQDKLENFYLQ